MPGEKQPARSGRLQLGDRIQNGLAVGGVLLRREGGQGGLVTGELCIPFYRPAHQPQEGIEPVDGGGRQGQGLEPDVPAAEMGQLVEQGVFQLFAHGTVLGEQEGGAEQPGQHGHRQARTEEEPGAAVQVQPVTQGLIGAENIWIPHRNGPPPQIGQKVHVGDQCPNEYPSGAGQPEQ